MPISFEYNKDDDILYEKMQGFVTVEEVINSFESRKGIVGYYPSVRKICDCRGIKFDLSNEGLKQIADYVKEHESYFGKTKWAIITSDPLTMAFARIYSILTQDSSVKTKAFSSVEEGLEWLRS